MSPSKYKLVNIVIITIIISCD